MFTEPLANGQIFRINAGHKKEHDRVVKIRHHCEAGRMIRAVYNRLGGTDDVWDEDHFREIIVAGPLERKPGDYAF